MDAQTDQRSDFMATVNQMANYSFHNYSSNSPSDSTSTILRDYASVKNGSYKKLLKAYYDKSDSKDLNTSISTSLDSSKTIAKIHNAALSLSSSADALSAKGSKSLFKATEGSYDMDRIYKAANSFVNDYNTMIHEGAKAESKSILKSTLSLTRLSKSNKNLLKDIGITVGSNNKLTIDEEAFKKADINKIKTLFQGASSYAANVSTKAAKIKGNALVEALKSNTYTNKANYSNTYFEGAIYSSFF